MGVEDQASTVTNQAYVRHLAWSNSSSLTTTGARWKLPIVTSRAATQGAKGAALYFLRIYQNMLPSEIYNLSR